MEKEKIKFLERTALFVLVFLIIFFIYLFFAFKFSSSSTINSWTKGCFDIKDRLMIEKSSPKIAVVGGSGTLFGISAEQIEKGTGISSVNYGIHAGLKTYMFERVKRVLKPGDILIIPLEYEYYSYKKKIIFEKQTPRETEILTFDADYFNKLPLLDKLNIIVANGPDLIRNIMYRNKEVKSNYFSSDLNEWGDQTNYSRNISYNKKFPLIDFPKDFDKKFPNYDGTREILELAKWCKNNNISFFASFPSALYLKEYDTPEFKARFKNIVDFYKENNISLIGKPEDFFYKEEYIYDAHYHLNQKGREIRTEFIIRELIKQIPQTKLFAKTK